MSASYPDSVVAFTDWVDDNPAAPGTGVDIKASTLNPRDDEIEALQTALGPRPVALNTFAEKKSTTSGLQWGFHGGRVVRGNEVRSIADGYVILPDNDTSYVYYNWADNEVTSSVDGFPEGCYPMAEVTALNSQFTGSFASRDRRTIAILSSGAPGGTGGELSRVVETADGNTDDYSCGFPAVSGSIMVFINGILQLPTIHYAIEADQSGNTHVVFLSAPFTGSAIYIAFQKNA